MKELEEIANHAYGIVEQILRSGPRTSSETLHYVHEASGIYLFAERAINTAHWKLDKLSEKSRIVK